MKLIPSLTFLVLVSAFCSSGFCASLTRDQILADADKVADAQIHAIGDKVIIDWIWGAMDVGYADYSHVSPKGADYQRWLAGMADKARWTPLMHKNDPFHADDFCIGQAWLDLYADHPDPSHLAPLKDRLDQLVDHINAEKPGDKLTWWWCDALFMAPPMMARMSSITKDAKYIDAMDKEYWRTTDLLHDRADHLFYRDASFLKSKDPNGKKIFWTRGNGWVVAGLAHVLEFMPADYPARPKYEMLFKDLAAKLITLQQADGTWPSNLVDADQFKGPETSGTALFTFGLSWGINNHLLDKKIYLPVVTRGWQALLADRRADGLPGYSQPVGAKPGPAPKDATSFYTTGGYLLSATQLQKLAPLDVP